MGVREKLSKNSALTTGAAVVLVVVATAIVVRSYWPEKKADLTQAFYSDDDGITWFTDSLFRVPPFDHNGKTSLAAQIYSYDDGSKQFCGYLTRFTPEAKKRLDEALANAQKRGQPPSSVSLYQDHNFMQRGMEYKMPGPNQPWITSDDPRVQKIF